MITKKVSIYNQKKVFVLLIRTNSFFSRVVHVLTKSEFTHASLGLDASCKELYSFARENRLPLPAGFVVENIETGMMAKSKKAPCALYEIDITNEAYRKLLKKLDSMIRRKGSLRYSLYGSVMCFFNLVSVRKDRFFCSQFVCEMLTGCGAITINKHTALYRPIDFTTQPELTLLYKGTLGDLADKIKLENIYTNAQEEMIKLN